MKLWKETMPHQREKKKGTMELGGARTGSHAGMGTLYGAVPALIHWPVPWSRDKKPNGREVRGARSRSLGGARSCSGPTGESGGCPGKGHIKISQALEG